MNAIQAPPATALVEVDGLTVDFWAGDRWVNVVDRVSLALAPGDMVSLMTSRGQVPVGAATKEVNAPTVFAANEGPALIELDGTAACRINLVAGEYS